MKLSNKRLLREESDPKKSIVEDQNLRTIDPVFNIDSTDAFSNEYNIFDVVTPDHASLFLETLKR